MMLNCGIEIATTTDGRTELFQADGLFFREGDRYSVRYFQDGDAVALDFDFTEFRMKRTGGSELSCVFRLNERTEMQFGGFGRTGKIPVETKNYSVLPSDKGCSVTLNYNFIFTDNFQTFQLNLNISTSEEK